MAAPSLTMKFVGTVANLMIMATLGLVIFALIIYVLILHHRLRSSKTVKEKEVQRQDIMEGGPASQLAE